MDDKQLSFVAGTPGSDMSDPRKPPHWTARLATLGGVHLNPIQAEGYPPRNGERRNESNRGRHQSSRLTHLRLACVPRSARERKPEGRERLQPLCSKPATKRPEREKHRWPPIRKQLSRS